MSLPAEQHEVAAFLSRLAGSAPKETHISAVFCGQDTVWKLKKAVRLPFLDFTRLDARHHFLSRELELNKPIAPGIYWDISAVVRQPDGSLALINEVMTPCTVAPSISDAIIPCAGGPQPVVLDWVLRMAPVPEADFLDAIAQGGGLTPALLDALGDCVAAFHAGLPPVIGTDSAAAFLRITEGNRCSALGAGLDSGDVEAWRRRMAAAIEARRDWLQQRAADGFVRRCHGDLHLGNLCLWKGKPTPFDALEFDEAMATIDTGYDLAFLLMDLDRRVGRAAANRVLNRAVARSLDAGAVAGLPIFLSQRAMVRAHVLTAMGRKDTGRDYLAAALAYLAPAPGFILAIGGLQGTGKSTLARALAPDAGSAPGALILRSDEIRKHLHGAAPEDRLPPKAYRQAANARVNRTLIELTAAAAKGGHGVIADATFLGPHLRHDLEAVAKQAAVPFIGVWLHAPLAVLEQRVAARQGDASDATVAVLRQSAAFDPGARGWVPVDATDAAAALAQVREVLRQSAHGQDVRGSAP